jgi:phage-related protein
MRRKIIAFGEYYHTFLHSLTDKEQLKVKYVLLLLETQDRLPVKFIKYIKDDLYELRITYNGNIFRLFFIFDEDKIVVLFNGFHTIKIIDFQWYRMELAFNHQYV